MSLYTKFSPDERSCSIIEKFPQRDKILTYYEWRKKTHAETAEVLIQPAPTHAEVLSAKVEILQSHKPSPERTIQRNYSLIDVIRSSQILIGR